MAEDTDRNDAPPEAKAGAAEPVAKKGRGIGPAGAAEAGAEALPAGDGVDVAPDAAAAETPPPARVVRRSARVSPVGVVHIKATFNNTIVSISDVRGNVVSWSSAGKAGFKGSRKSTAFAATVVGQDAARAASAKGMHEVEVHIQGAGSGRESAVRAIQSSGLVISAIKDITPIPHNGCRQRKRRRV